MPVDNLTNKKLVLIREPPTSLISGVKAADIEGGEGG
jgi:hypothetical protein